MKNFIIQCNPYHTIRGMFQEFRQAIAGKKLIQPKNLMIVDSIATAYKVMSKTRMEVFYAISAKKPANIKQLACSLNKDYANVWKDCQALANLGIIKLKKESSTIKGSVQIKPIALYERIIFDFPIQVSAQKPTISLATVNKSSTTKHLQS